MEKEYYLGLDMGTGSTGWAVTDTEYKLCRKYGKDVTVRRALGHLLSECERK